MYELHIIRILSGRADLLQNSTTISPYICYPYVTFIQMLTKKDDISATVYLHKTRCVLVLPYCAGDVIWKQSAQ